AGARRARRARGREPPAARHRPRLTGATHMKLVTFSDGGPARPGLVRDDAVVDLALAAPELPRDMAALLAAGPEALAAVRRAADAPGRRLPLAAVRLGAPVPRPPKFLAIFLNYPTHA